MNRNNCLLAAALIMLLPACNAVDDVRERLRGATPREDYMQALASAGLLETALARDWVSAAEAALRQPLSAEVPVEETGYLDAAEPHAVALRLRLQRGQRVAVRADLLPAADALLFLDVLRIDSASTSPPRHIISADSGGRSLEFEPSRTADYIVRLQPELLRGGRYTLTIRSGPALAFPVHGVGARAIGSRFGAPRDGGARDHHGVDIFAPRGTPVLAAAAGYVNGVRETQRGGRVVWLRDERRSLSLYYAHLDTQLVANGTAVSVGDTLGTVGNTGNARGTPPHLHFGIYSRGWGPVDPLPFIDTRRGEPADIAADTSLLGTRVRFARPQGTLRAAPGPNAESWRPVSRSGVLTVLGAAGSSFRVRLPDGTSGFVAAGAVQPAVSAVSVVTREAGTILRERPSPAAVVVDSLTSRVRLAVLGRFGRWLLVATEGRREGWITE